MRENILEEIRVAIANIAHADELKQKVEEALSLNIDPLKILDCVSKGLDEVGRKYESGEYFLMELILAGNLASEVTNMLRPYLKAKRRISRGKVVIGTVEGDLHDIGKNIVISMLSSAGFEVIDLGVDVSAEKFIDAVKRENPDILAMSCLLTVGLPHMREVIEKLKEKGLRDKVKVMVGGRPVTPEYAREIGADAYGADAVDAVNIAERWVGGTDK